MNPGLRRPLLAACGTLVALIAATGSADARYVALTFDDGPSRYTPQVLSVLRRDGVPATFFMLGSQVRAYPNYARAVEAAGDQIGNHSWDHPNLTTLANAAVLAQLRRTNDIIRATASVSPTVFRPPFGATSPRIRGLVRSSGMAHILWTIDPLDWRQPGAATIRSRVLNAADRDEIVLLHDGGGTDRFQTVAALDGIIAGLRARGYRFVTVTDFIRLANRTDVNGAKDRDDARQASRQAAVE